MHCASSAPAHCTVSFHCHPVLQLSKYQNSMQANGSGAERRRAFDERPSHDASSLPPNPLQDPRVSSAATALDAELLQLQQGGLDGLFDLSPASSVGVPASEARAQRTSTEAAPPASLPAAASEDWAQTPPPPQQQPQALQQQRRVTAAQHASEDVAAEEGEGGGWRKDAAAYAGDEAGCTGEGAAGGERGDSTAEADQAEVC